MYKWATFFFEKKKIYKIIKESNLFDSNWYSKNNLDVVKVGMDPLKHYLNYGWLEGRDPSIRFSTSWYLASNQDVAKKGINPLLHFILWGREEGRYPTAFEKIKDDLGLDLQENLETDSTVNLVLQAKKYCREIPGLAVLEQFINAVVNKIWSENEWKFRNMAEKQERLALIDSVQITVKEIFELWKAYVLRQEEFIPNLNINKNRVLIIGDYGIPQCVRYRIDQKLEQLKIGGFVAEAISWERAEEARQLIYLYDQIIFYRVPAYPKVIRLIAEAQALGKTVFYEIDDLLFDPEYPPPIEEYGGLVEQDEYNDITMGMALYRSAATLCSYGIASTEPLSKELGNLVVKKISAVHRNGVDRRLLWRYKINAAHETINIFYGSGTRAHIKCEQELLFPVIVKILNENQNVKFTLVGHLDFSREILMKYQMQINLIPYTHNYVEYISLLSEADINLAILVRDKFNDCKSEIKWLEAAFYGIPSVLTNTKNYGDCVVDNFNGRLIDNRMLYNELSELINNNSKRMAIGFNAKNSLYTYTTNYLSGRLKNIFR
jgi:glycosyltransferase involved in cell wall biosynthesis